MKDSESAAYEAVRNQPGGTEMTWTHIYVRRGDHWDDGRCTSINERDERCTLPLRHLADDHSVDPAAVDSDPLADGRPTTATLVREALHLRMYGERAPGGDETWGGWEQKADRFLRGLTFCPKCGHPDDYHASTGCSMPLAADGLPAMNSRDHAERCGCLA